MVEMNYTEDALAFRLRALDNPIPLTPSDPHLHQKLICWLEDAYIRRLPIPSRESLREQAFLPALKQYLAALDAPPPEDDLLPTVAYLTDLALHLHYQDSPHLYNTPHDPWEGRCVPVIPDAADDVAVLASVKQLTDTLGMPEPDSAVDGLRALADIVESANSDGKEVSLDEMPLGFETGDPAVDQAAKVLRLLYVRRLREVQDGINEIVAAMQNVTADPKTNSKLGKVGR